jgi:hypothetical protein
MPVEEEVPVPGPVPVLKVGVAATLELCTLAVLTLPEVVAAPPVPPVSPVFPAVTPLLTLQAPVRVDITLMLCNAAGVEPQFAACVIQTRLLSRSKTTKDTLVSPGHFYAEADHIP